MTEETKKKLSEAKKGQNGWKKSLELWKSLERRSKTKNK